MSHGYFYSMVAGVYGGVLETVSFGAENDRQLFCGGQPWVTDTDGVLTQSHCSRNEAQLPEMADIVGGAGAHICPRELKDSAHADTDRAAEERVAA